VRYLGRSNATEYGIPVIAAGEWYYEAQIDESSFPCIPFTLALIFKVVQIVSCGDRMIALQFLTIGNSLLESLVECSIIKII